MYLVCHLFGETCLKGVRQSRPKVDSDDKYLHESNIVNKVVCGYDVAAGEEYYKRGDVVSATDPPNNYVQFLFDGHRTFQIRVKYTSEVINSDADISRITSLHLSDVVLVGNVSENDNTEVNHAAVADLEVGQMFGIPREELREEFKNLNIDISWIVDRIDGNICFCSVIDPENIVNGHHQYATGDVRRWAFLF